MSVLLALALTSACSPHPQLSQNEKWVAGEYAVTPVVKARQSELLRRLGRGAFMGVDYAFARKVTGDATLKPGPHHYLIKVAWISDAPAGTVPGHWVKVGVDVDSRRMAYVQSFLLSRSQGSSEYAAILTSSVSLRGVIALCGAAE